MFRVCVEHFCVLNVQPEMGENFDDLEDADEDEDSPLEQAVVFVGSIEKGDTVVR